MLQHTRSANISLHPKYDACPQKIISDRWISDEMHNSFNETEKLMVISYLQDKLVVIERIKRVNGRLIPEKKLVYYLTHTKGRAVVAVIMSILRYKDGEIFSKHTLKEHIDQEYFLPYDENVSSADINDSIKRMLRSTLNGFYEVDGKYIRRHNFALYLNELNNKVGDEIDYHYYKFRIENYRDKIIKEIERDTHSI